MSSSSESSPRKPHELTAQVLEEIAKELHPYQAVAAARRIRELPGDERSRRFRGDIADALETEVAARTLAGFRGSDEGSIPDASGVLDEVTIAAITGLPQTVRGMMFNAHGEPLVYGTDDRVYHGDAEWHGYEVVHGEAPGLVLDSVEQGFVRALWESAEEVRRAKAPGSNKQD